VGASNASRHDGALLLFSSLALSVLALASVSLLKMLMQLGRLPRARTVT
jgi:hypothetical protein